MSFLRTYFYFYQASRPHKFSINKKKKRKKERKKKALLLKLSNSFDSTTQFIAGLLRILLIFFLLAHITAFYLFFATGTLFTLRAAFSEVYRLIWAHQSVMVTISLTVMPSFWGRTMRCSRRNFHQAHRLFSPFCPCQISIFTQILLNNWILKNSPKGKERNCTW